MMDCGALPFCVLVGCSCALWCLLRVMAHGELGQVCPFGKWGGVGAMTLMVIAPGYLMACSASPCCLPPLARGFLIEEMCQVLSRKSVSAVLFPYVLRALRLPSVCLRDFGCRFCYGVALEWCVL